MVIQGRYEEYSVTWRTCGWSYAEAVVRGKRKFLWFFARNKILWATTNHTDSFPQWTCAFAAERFSKKEMRDWFEFAVKEYEDYLDGWK